MSEEEEYEWRGSDTQCGLSFPMFRETLTLRVEKHRTLIYFSDATCWQQKSDASRGWPVNCM